MPRPHLAALAALTLALNLPCHAAEPAPRDSEVKEAVKQGLALVQKAAANYPAHRSCFSCHHQTLPMLAMIWARERGIAADTGLLQEQADFTLESFQDKREAMREGKGVGG